jgi:5-methyltetrahydrofolate--homocysteine methyltransferase
MAGMDEVGRQFNANQLIVAEVLQSAEAMKFAVAHLEPHMERADSATKGKVILATVKGDVHDIGKNLVDIILSNNGYQVINLGIKVPPQDLIAACNEHDPDIVGLSGLLVKSAQMMVETVRDFRQAGVEPPILVGGAALSNRFTRLRIAPEYDGLVAYAQDAMSGLALANTLQDADERQKLASDIEAETDELIRSAQARESAEASATTSDVAPAQVRHDFEVPNPPDLRLHVILDYDLSELFPYINPQMLYVRHLGYKGRFAEALEKEEGDALELRDSVRKVEDIMLAHRGIRANAVFKFFPCRSEGQNLLIYAPDGETVLERFYFGRQSQREGLCLSDYARSLGSGKPDYVAMFTTTVGPAVRALADEMRDKGEFLNSHILQVLALESAEAFAELLHKQIRQMWGIGDPSGLTYQDLFRTQYRGRRYSFGYPACPRLEDQEQLFRLLDVHENIGVELTEGYMMDPEGSVSAIVFHHPEAKYFNLSEQDTEKLEGEITSKGL